MTLITAFSTFTNTNNRTSLQLQNLENMYLLADSRLSQVINKKTSLFSNNNQKIFYCRVNSIIFAISGVYDIAKKIIDRSIKAIIASNKVFNNSSDKIDFIIKIFKIEADKFHSNNYKTVSVILGITTFENNFYPFKIVIAKDKRFVKGKLITFTEKIQIDCEGADNDSFEEYYETYLKENKLESSATIFFTCFNNYLHSEHPTCSAPPCQGIILNKNGKIKELSIKHPDGLFYKLGKNI